MESKSYKNKFILLTVLILLIVGIYLFLNKSEESAKDNSSEEILMTENLVDELIEGKSFENSYYLFDYTINNESYQIRELDSNKYIEISEEAIKIIKDNNEKIEHYQIPTHPINDEIIFLATSNMDDHILNPEAIENKIYTYNIKTGDLKIVLRNKTNRILRILGIYGSKLILSNNIKGRYGGPCYSEWIDGELVSLELANIKSGLETFKTPQFKIEEELVFYEIFEGGKEGCFQ